MVSPSRACSEATGSTTRAGAQATSTPPRTSTFLCGWRSTCGKIASALVNAPRVLIASAGKLRASRRRSVSTAAADERAVWKPSAWVNMMRPTWESSAHVNCDSVARACGSSLPDAKSASR